MARVDQRRITVKVTDAIGVMDLGVADTKSGGGVTTETTKTRPGGMEPEKDYGGPGATVEDLELSFVDDLNYDLRTNNWLPRLRAIVGSPDAVVVTEQPLDRDKNAKGKPDVFKGSLVSVATPDYDANSTGDVGKLGITVSVSGPVG